MTIYRFTVIAALAPSILFAQGHEKKFSQLGTELPTPNNYRTASGAPGHEYWQQKADYTINVAIDDEKQVLTGREDITYFNNSPDELRYLWLQLDQNLFDRESDTYKTETGKMEPRMNTWALNRQMEREKYDGGFKIKSVSDKSGNKLKYTINKTMMRVELPAPLKPKSSFAFKVDWYYNINNARTTGGRSGYEFFEKDGNYIYEMAQWFPRMAVYDDVNGWQHKQFLGGGEFALTFGDYRVSITVPSDFVVGASGTLQNAGQVLTKAQQERWEKAKRSFDKPMIIVTPDEAKKAEKAKAKETKTWVYEAKNVRDFAFACSRKYIWDAMAVKIGGREVMAMSYYPNEGNPLWEKYSTEAVAHTLRVYSRFTIDYPYPVAISCNGPVGGMEYPMICFNGPRPEPDGTYSSRTKYGLISVIIHEVGHNFFPMIINSDERQWTWMDEGLNTFVQYLAECEWEKDYPSRRGDPRNIVAYMKSDPAMLEPIMTNSESVTQLGNNAYGKPATALNILRETVMGRELFDYAFKEYSRRWAFKHPMPADFFRTMEDASGVDLDWFWRGWFYGIEPVDIAIENVKWYVIDTQDPETENPRKKAEANESVRGRSYVINEKELAGKTLVEKKPELADFYNDYDEFKVLGTDKVKFQSYYGSLSDDEKKLLRSGKNFYAIDFKNAGGLIMPIILQMEFEDGTEKTERIPAEIWRKNDKAVTKVFITDKPVKQFVLDPYFETADIETGNNSFPPALKTNRFELFKESRQRGGKNPMQIQRETEGDGKQ